MQILTYFNEIPPHFVFKGLKGLPREINNVKQGDVGIFLSEPVNVSITKQCDYFIQLEVDIP